MFGLACALTRHVVSLLPADGMVVAYPWPNVYREARHDHFLRRRRA
jgi:hypothetical protein